jgi:DNA-binding SARP family transcriptional activator
LVLQYLAQVTIQCCDKQFKAAALCVVSELEALIKMHHTQLTVYI